MANKRSTEQNDAVGQGRSRPTTHRADGHSPLHERIARRQRRRQRALQEGDRSIWFGVGMFGLVGWSVALPTVGLTALGVWIDARTKSAYSWTLMLLIVGVAIGCWNAWVWVSRERRPPGPPSEHEGEPSATEQTNEPDGEVSRNR